MKGNNDAFSAINKGNMSNPTKKGKMKGNNANNPHNNTIFHI